MIKKEREKVNFINDYAGTETLLPGNANMGALLRPKNKCTLTNGYSGQAACGPALAEIPSSSGLVATTRLT